MRQLITHLGARLGARLGADLLHLIAPALCPGCDELLEPGEHGYCGACRASLEPAPYPRDLFNDLVAHTSADGLALSAIGALYRFERGAPVQRLIHALKYRGCMALGAELGGELGRALRVFSEFDGVDLVLPVPLHAARRRERGYNQAETIAAGIARVLDVPMDARLLARTRHTGTQTTLGADARRVNVLGAFRATAALAGAHLLLCDDVCTTGATLNACAEVLLAAGAASVRAATVAKDDP